MQRRELQGAPPWLVDLLYGLAARALGREKDTDNPAMN